MKKVWAVDRQYFIEITNGKAYDVIEEGVSLGRKFYRVNTDKGYPMGIFADCFTEEPPKGE